MQICLNLIHINLLVYLSQWLSLSIDNNPHNWVSWRLEQPVNRLFVQQLVSDILKCILFNENIWSSLKISLKFVLKVRINNVPALVQKMAWHRPGDKPWSEPMMVSLLTHICVTRPQWVKGQLYGNCFYVMAFLRHLTHFHLDPNGYLWRKYQMIIDRHLCSRCGI